MIVLNVKNVTVPLPRKAVQKSEKINEADQLHNLVSKANFSLNSGEILGIIGPNGAGKSSLLKAIEGGLEYRGDILMPLISSEAKLRAKQFAVLPQLSPLSFPFTVAEVVELGRIPHATGKQKDLAIVAEALALMDITYLAERNYTQLSGGEKQRVQLARVFCQIWEPEPSSPCRLLLLDEPSSALDLGHQHHLMRAVKLFAARGVAIIMVMHDINLAARYADSLLALLCSEQIAYGSPKEVVQKATMERLFGLHVEVLNSAKHDSPILVGA